MESQNRIRDLVLESIRNLSDEEINVVVEEETWSIAQVLEHLYIMEVNVTRQIELALQQDAFDKPGTFPLHVIADRTKKISAPEFLIPSNDFHTVDDLKQKLASSRASLEKIIGQISEDELNRITFAHRRFGVLTLKQWVELVGYHEQRHIDQIEEIKVALKKATSFD